MSGKLEDKTWGLYIRVSTDAQREEGYSVDAQKEMLIGYCVSKQIAKYELYVDGGFTGSNIDRPELTRLVNDVKDGKIGGVAVYKLDRLSRSQKDTLYLIEDVFNPYGVSFVSLQETMDTSTPLGRLMIGILSAFAQLERENIRERTRMGMKERVKSGLWMGGGRIPFGYDYDSKQGILVPNKDAETVRNIYNLYLQGYSLEKVSQTVGLKYEKLAHQILNRKTNIGYICYNGEEYKGKHEPIVSDEVFYKAMDMQQQRASTGAFVSSQYLLTGLLVCGKCGAKMRYQKWGKSGHKIRCYSQYTGKAYLVKDPDCDVPPVWAEEVEKVVLDTLFNVSFNEIKEKASITYSVIEALAEQVEMSKKKIRRLYGLYATAEDDQLLETINETKKDLKRLEDQLKRERDHNIVSNNEKEIRLEVANLKNAWEHMSKQARQTIIRKLIRSVTYDGNRTSIDFIFN